MTHKLRTLILSGLMVLGLSAAPLVLAGNSVYATTATDNVTKGLNATGASNGKNLQKNIKTVVNVILFLLGAIAVIMIILGGVRYVLSNGEASQVTAAKNTILYAVIGLIVALLAYAIVNFVVDQFTKP
ncbi:hypothetical protein RAAC3_TM7C00001G0333 [Candidatus Saccharibacteria bacterium RAAC3_TM7_1]|nr:hypothetical protein RAAC3_TM7C00001G0333 [Candidatus Saccharibacteria bacterium RAAC3_TM7_1]HCZ28287.1 hypothetical protein [Candidatus Saccharibacteria bacterium]